MTIKAGLLAGFAAVILATLALGVHAVHSIRAVNELLQRTYDSALMSSAHAQSAHTAFVKLDRMLEAGGPGDGAAVEGLERTLLADLDVVRQRALDPEAPAVVAEIRRLYDAWKPGRATDEARREP
jgi:hypothetical protein